MNYEEAMKEMSRGEKARRKIYTKGVYVYFNKNGILSCVDGHGHEAIFVVKKADHSSDDWEIYNPEPVLNPCGCGGVPRLKTGTTLSRVECKCGMMTDSFEKDKAVKVWNAAHPIRPPKKQTNFEKYITAKFLEDVTDECVSGDKEDNCFVACMIRMLKEKGQAVDIECSCHRLKCNECCARFVSWAKSPAEEVKV